MLSWSGLLVAVLLLLAGLVPRFADRFFRPVEAAFSRLAARRTFVVVLIFFVAILLRLALLPLIPVPVPGNHDEFSYLLAADTFAHGRLANPPHPLWLSFETFHVNWFPTYSSKFPPAQGLVLAAGQLLGHPWIGVLLSVAAMCAAITWMLQAWLPARWALLGGLIVLLKLALISYWVNSYWGGAVAAVGGALLLGALPRIFRKPRTGHAWLLGLGVVILASSRPLEGLILCLPAAAALLWWLGGRSSPPLRVTFRRVVAPVAVLVVLLAAFTAYYNFTLTGNALLLPYNLYMRTYDPVGLFLWQPQRPLQHYHNTQLEDLYNDWARSEYSRSWDDVKSVSREKLENYTEAFFWPGAFPLLFCLPLLFRDRRMRLLLVTLALSALGLFAVIWPLPHYAAPVICALYALLLQCLRHLRTLRFARRPAGVGLSRLLFLLLLFTVGSGLYQRFADPYAWDWNGNMGNWRRAHVSAKLQQMPGKQLVLVRYAALHNVHEEWVYNDAAIDAAKIVWAREMDPAQNRKLLNYYRDRQVWLVQPDEDPEGLTPFAMPPAPSPPPTSP
ncbi:MAG: hypothetical protein LAN84_12620 [Acidobacteriia bacterium]|nr:hypothetical protein [Terriglobia bacterium]